MSRDWNSSLPRKALASIHKGTGRYSYRGIPCIKSPFDFALYTRLVHELRPGTILEIGSNRGGSALWLADLQSTFGIEGGQVHSFDLRPARAMVEDPRITFHAADALDLGKVASPAFMAGLRRPLLVIEDSAHYYETTLAVLRFFHRYLEVGEYIVVEDGIVGTARGLGKWECYADGPNRAVRDFLEESEGRYMVDTEYCDFFGHNFTYNTNGWLKRIA